MGSCGIVIPHTPIAIDLWQIDHPVAKLFFLSHCHSDHMQGLKANWPYKLYTSDISKKILIEQFEVSPSLIQALAVNQTHFLPIDDDPDTKEYFSVDVIDANHCAGSVMYLFKGYFGTVLYSGDFSYSLDFKCYPLVQNSIDIVYIDDTYLDDDREFINAHDASIKVKDICVKHSNVDIFIGTKSYLGREKLWMNIATQIKELICVDYVIYKNMSYLYDDLSMFTTSRIKSRIFITKFKNCYDHSFRYPKDNCVFIYTSSMLDHVKKPSQHIIYTINYSDHSSSQKLHEFVNYLKPSMVRAITQKKNITSHRNLDKFNYCLNKKVYKPRITPNAVENFMKKRSWNMLRCNEKSDVKRSRRNLKKGVIFSDLGPSTYCVATQNHINRCNKKVVVFNEIDDIETSECFKSHYLKNWHHSCLNSLSSKNEENVFPMNKSTEIDKSSEMVDSSSNLQSNFTELKFSLDITKKSVYDVAQENVCESKINSPTTIFKKDLPPCGKPKKEKYFLSFCCENIDLIDDLIKEEVLNWNNFSSYKHKN